MRKTLILFFILFLVSPALSAELHLDDGWNMISYSGSGLETSDFQGACNLEGGPWAWDTSNDEFVYHESVDPYRGYWVKVDGDCTVEVASSPVTMDSMDLDRGWNLVSVSTTRWGVEEIQSSGCDLVGGPWADSSSGWSFQEVMAPMVGYWIKVGSDCTVDIPESGTGDNGEQDNDGETREQSSDSVYSYDTTREEWRLSQEEFAALAAIPKGMAPNSEVFNYNGQTLAQMVKNVRERAIDYHHWQYQAKDTVQYGNPEDVSMGGKTYFVSSSEGFVLQPGTPAPHCYYDYGYQPPRFGSLSSRVMERTPTVDTRYADTDEDQECPSWLTDELMANVESMLDRKEDSESTETFEDVSWNGWDFTSTRFTGSENDEDYLDDVSAGNDLTIDTGNTGYCGKAYVQNQVSVSDRVKRITAEVEIITGGDGRQAAIWVDGQNVANASSEGSHALNAYIDSDSTIKVGIVGDQENKEQCNQYGRRMKVKVESIDVSTTNFPVDDTESSSSQETFEDVSWNGWDFNSERFTAPETQNKEDYLGNVYSNGALTIDTGYNGYCGKAFIQDDISVSDRSKEITANIEITRPGTGTKAVIWDDGSVIDTASSEGSHSLVANIASDSTIRVGMIGDTENKEMCDDYSRLMEMDINSISVETTQFAVQ